MAAVPPPISSTEKKSDESYCFYHGKGGIFPLSALLCCRKMGKERKMDLLLSVLNGLPEYQSVVKCCQNNAPVIRYYSLRYCI